MIPKINRSQVNESAVFSLITFFGLLFAPVLLLAAPSIPVKEIKLLYTLKGDEQHRLSLPSDVSADKNGNVYVVDSGNHRVAVFDDDGDFVTSFSAKGRGDAELLNPVGIDVTKEKVYVADKDNHRIQVYNKEGKLLKSIQLKQGKTKVRPVDVVVKPQYNLLYITGNNTHKLMAYNMDGKLLHHWGGEGTNRGEFRYPATVSVYKGNIYAVDVLNSRVQVFNARGELQAIAGGWGVLPGQLFRPKGVALDKEGNIYISDSYLGLVQVFAADMKFRYVLGNKGKPYKLSTPAGIAVANNRLYVCEMLKNRVSVFSLEP